MKLSIEPLNIEALSPERNRAVEARILSVLESWERTPYLSGSQAKKHGVDCVRFVSGVLDELYGRTTPLPLLPQDASFHVKDTCQNALRSFMKRYDYLSVEDGVLQPGDIVMMGPVGGGPGHALIAGLRGLWHCDQRAVTRTGLSFSSGGVYFYKKALRGSDRERWDACTTC